MVGSINCCSFSYYFDGDVMSDLIDNANKAQQCVTDLKIANRVRYVGVSLYHCERCGEQIPQRRRELVPGVKLCVECAQL